MVVVARRVAPLAAALLLVTLASGPAQAQAAVGSTVLYADALPAAGGSVGLVPQPPEGTDATTSCVGTCPDPFVLTATSEPLPAMGLAGDMVEAVAWFKSWNNAPAPGTTVSFSVLVDGTEVAAGSATKDILLGAIVEFRIAMPYTGGALPAGSVVTWVVTATDNGVCDCYVGAAYPRGVSADHPWSVGLPLVASAGGASETIFETLNGTAANITRSFNGTSGTFVYNWTGPAGPLTLTAGANGTGNATLVVTDPGNATAFSGNLTQPASTVQLNGTAGNWTLRLTLSSFNGTVHVRLAPKAVPVNSVGSRPTSTTSANATSSTPVAGNGTGAADSSTVPVPATVALGALAFAAVAIRRRRHG